MEERSEESACASLVVIGIWFQHQEIWSLVESHVRIKQKVRQYTANEKLLDCFLNILSGGQGLYETNLRVRPDQAVQQAFGRIDCAEQSTISDTLNACTAVDVAALRQAVKAILRQQGECYYQDYAKEWQLLDIDMTGMPAGRQGEAVTKGYFANTKNRRVGSWDAYLPLGMTKLLSISSIVANVNWMAVCPSWLPRQKQSWPWMRTDAHGQFCALTVVGG